MKRRGLILAGIGLLTAPSIVRASSLMKVVPFQQSDTIYFDLESFSSTGYHPEFSRFVVRRVSIAKDVICDFYMDTMGYNTR